MDMKQKVLVGIAVLLIAILTGTYICGSVFVGNAEAEQTPIVGDFQYPKFSIDDVESAIPDYAYDDEGYSDLITWWNDLQAERKSYAGTAEQMIATYNDYLSEEQKAFLREYENDMTGALNFTELNVAKDEFNKVVNAAKSDKEAAEEAARKAEEARRATEAAERQQQNNSSSGGGGNYSGSYYDFLRDGIIYYAGNKYSYYSQSVLPGKGLRIPGRHVSGGFVRDGDGYIVLANDKPNGTIVDTPFGLGKIYDKGTYGNHYDIYVE